MSTISYEIEEYKATLCSRDSGWVGSYRYMAVISLYHGGKAVASLRFLPAVGNTSDSFYVDRSGQEILRLYYEDADFDRVLNLLQTEKPLYVHLRRTYQGNEGIGSLSTLEEPVGEEEG